MFFNFGFLSEYIFLGLQHFMQPSAYPVNSIFSVVVCVYMIHVFDEAFSLLAILAMISEKMLFLLSWQPLLGKNFLIKSCNLSIQIRQREPTQEKSSQKCILQPNTKVRDPTNSLKMYQKYIFWIFTTICYHIQLKGLYLLLNMSYFS